MKFLFITVVIFVLVLVELTYASSNTDDQCVAYSIISGDSKADHEVVEIISDSSVLQVTKQLGLIKFYKNLVPQSKMENRRKRRKRSTRRVKPYRRRKKEEEDEDDDDEEEEEAKAPTRTYLFELKLHSLKLMSSHEASRELELEQACRNFSAIKSLNKTSTTLGVPVDEIFLSSKLKFGLSDFLKAISQIDIKAQILQENSTVNSYAQKGMLHVLIFLSDFSLPDDTTYIDLVISFKSRKLANESLVDEGLLLSFGGGSYLMLPLHYVDGGKRKVFPENNNLTMQKDEDGTQYLVIRISRFGKTASVGFFLSAGHEGDPASISGASFSSPSSSLLFLFFQLIYFCFSCYFV